MERRVDALASASPFVLVGAVCSVAFLFAIFGNDMPPALLTLAMSVAVLRRISGAVTDPLRSRRGLRIIQALVGIGGVELPEQLNLLRKLECNAAQRYVILEPVASSRQGDPPDEANRMLELCGSVLDYRKARRAALARRRKRSA